MDRTWALAVLFAVAVARSGAAGVEEASIAADRVLTAIAEGKDLAALRIEHECDPWLVAEELCVRGSTDAAAALAGATHDLPLVAYLAKRGIDERDRAAMAALKEAESLRISNRPAKALDVIAATHARKNTVVAASLAAARADCLRDAGRKEESNRAFLDAGKAAARIGWRELRDRSLLPLATQLAFDDAITGGELLPLQERLKQGEALCVYVEADGELLVLIVGAERPACVPLGSAAEARKVLAPWGGIDPKADVGGLLDRSRNLLVERPGLAEGPGAVLVVWPADLGIVPFASLLEHRPAALLRRAEHLRRLRDAEARRRGGGDRILEVTGPPEEGGARVGGVVLQRRTVQGLQEAIGERRWAALHLSCPYVGAPDERSGLQCLLLGTYERGQNEKEVLLGPLKLRDPPVDLVMLATDVGGDTETWIAGLRASRVIACRWRQDAAASEVFMRAFYARWRGESGPTPASLALLQARKAVASKPEYAHPYYWAGWQLWGLP